MWKPGSSIRDSDWKLVEFYHCKNFVLYNRTADLGENKNLAKSNPKKAAELRAKLAPWQKQLGAKMPVLNPDYDPNAKPKPRKPKKKK